jgi:hypothetical protein
MTYLVELPMSVAGDVADVVKVEIEETADGLVRVARLGRVVARASRSLTWRGQPSDASSYPEPAS